MQTIKYTKNYYEDIGKDEKTGNYLYAYCYYLYHFYLPDGEVIRFRQYTDTAERCSLFYPLNELAKKPDTVSKEKLYVIYAVIRFMKKEFNITEFYFFNKEYLPVDMSNIGEIPHFTFEQLSE
jgi:hypothetical protein